ncbi:YkgJ family cysteine cluster protein [Paenibacillus campi]|uniref:YkgJ family cysteine cluster protein n=1 Tax=Paenibacillus campi TaxID=3106031 RepID=UPI002AFF0673|nr:MULTISPECIES: YkgJ family cysteine cluster protein [unclassified Paenibacillus]
MIPMPQRHQKRQHNRHRHNQDTAQQQPHANEQHSRQPYATQQAIGQTEHNEPNRQQQPYDPLSIQANDRNAAASKLSADRPCFCGSGRALKDCHPRAAANSRAMHMTALYKQVDTTIEQYHANTSKHPPCAAGCSSCCSDYFPVSQVEFELLLTYMEHSWSQADIDAAFRQAERNLEQFRQHNEPMYAALVNRTNRKQELDSIRHHAGRNNFACPLLDPEQGICRVYPVRPFICRTHGSSHTFYGTWRERFSSERVCEHIPSSRAHRRITPNIADYWQPYEQLADVYVGAQRQPLRQYPIFYWLVLYQRHGGGATTQIGNRDNFELSLEQHNAQMAAYGTDRS